LAAQELAHGLVGLGERADVSERSTEREQIARRVGRFERGEALRLRHLERTHERALSRYAGERQPGRVTIPRAARVERRLLLGRHGAVEGWAREVRGALEDGERGRLPRDDRDRLYARRARADDRHPLSREVDGLVRPAAGVVRGTTKARDARNVRRLREREASARHHVEEAADLVAAVGAHAPARGLVVPRGGD